MYSVFLAVLGQITWKVIWNQNQNHWLKSDFKSKSLLEWFKITDHFLKNLLEHNDNQISPVQFILYHAVIHSLLQRLYCNLALSSNFANWSFNQLLCCIKNIGAATLLFSLIISKISLLIYHFESNLQHRNRPVKSLRGSNFMFQCFSLKSYQYWNCCTIIEENKKADKT